MNIREHRKKVGLSQCDLAKELGVTQSAVACWERGSSSPRAKTLKKLCSILQCSADEILLNNEQSHYIEGEKDI